MTDSHAHRTAATHDHDLPRGITADDVHAAASTARSCPVIDHISTAQQRAHVAHFDAELEAGVPLAGVHEERNPNITRIRLPHIADLVLVHGAEEIKAFEKDPDVGRGGEGRLPFWFFSLLKASKFYCSSTERWFVGFEGASCPAYRPRIDYVIDKLSRGYTPKDVEECAQLLRRNPSDEEVGAYCARFAAKFFISEPVPDEVVHASLQNIIKGIPTPSRYLRAARSCTTMYSFVKGKVPDEHVEDVIHNIGAAAGGMHAVLRIIRDKANGIHNTKDVSTAVSPTPIIDQVPRVAVGSGTVGGLLEKPLVPNETLILLKIGVVASATGDDNFLFGPGTEARQCPFKPLLLRFSTDVAKYLQEHGAASQ